MAPYLSIPRDDQGNETPFYLLVRRQYNYHKDRNIMPFLEGKLSEKSLDYVGEKTERSYKSTEEECKTTSQGRGGEEGKGVYHRG